MPDHHADDSPTADVHADGTDQTSDSPPVAQIDDNTQAGQSIGPYKLLQQIGEGGFGIVWMAEQREPIKRRVALKVIKLGMDTKQVIARFEAERQALAMMDHPNIAKVYDAGATETGRPFFAMEYIRGIPIAEYCDHQRLDTEARLRLMVDVCNAIQHAHQKGVIHRDIKPSNVLVTMHDSIAVPKVIDFGIAKATNTELTQHTLFTEHRQMIGTPVYMSPEQAEMSGLDIDTRSDIYSLGVLIYELLTGTTPFSQDELSSGGYDVMRKIILEREPHKPSTRISGLGDEATSKAKARRLDTNHLQQRLTGDLDWITMKCLEKDRTRRYETASELAQDITRHLNDEPVIAGPPGAAYKIRKFMKRHRPRVIAAGFAIALLIVSMIGILLTMSWALAERQRADIEAQRASTAAESAVNAQAIAEQNEQDAIDAAQRAERELRRATEFKSFLTRMLTSLDPAIARGEDTTLIEILLAGARRDLVTQQLDDPVLRIELAQLLGEVYRAFGRADLAVALFERAAADGTLALGPEAPATLNAQIELALAYWDLSANTEAMRVLTTMIPAATQSLGSTHRLTLWAHDVLAAVLLDVGRYQEALVHAELAYKGALETAGPENHDTAVFARRYAEILRVLGRIEEAKPLEAGVLEALARSRGQYHPTTIQERFMIISRRRQEGDPQAILEVPAIIDLLRAHTGERSAVTTLAETTFATWLIEDEQYAQAADYLASLTDRLLPISPTNKQHREILSMLEQAAGLADRPDLVAKAQQHALQPPQLPVWVYDEPLTQQIYAPSGHMGETQTTDITIYARDESQPDRGSFIRITLKPETSWTGIVWQDPAHNWGTRPGGYDLTAATRIVFDARSPEGHGLFTIGMGTRANDQHRADTGFIEEQFTATTEWQTYSLDISAIDRSRIFSGVVFVVSGAAEQVTIDLDRIRYE